MIRNVVVGRVRAGGPREQVERALAAIVALEPPGCLEHNRVRRELFEPICDEIARIQFETPSRPPSARV